MIQGSYVPLPKSVIWKNIPFDQLTNEHHGKGTDGDGFYVPVTLQFWLGEKPQVATLRMQYPEKGDVWNEETIWKELKTQLRNVNVFMPEAPMKMILMMAPTVIRTSPHNSRRMCFSKMQARS
eukprot:GHVU01107602.1.p1 GENE.GHVU01107602.1~~GHVU01107602.1.p1  ORF type:complete len:123 (+),score=18.29 GHVU01107602.1:480-848(+)